jgi:hypothetical protein
MKLLFLSNAPKRSNNYWQLVFIPTVALYKQTVNPSDWHVAFNFEWLFWSATLLIHSNDETVVYQFNDN